MMELLNNLLGAIRAGWLQYAEKGMYIGAFFVAMLFLWLVCYDKFAAQKADGRKTLFLYVVAITGLILCPVSAFFLLKYQTAFFTYSQLFLLIPMTLVMAWALTEAVTLVLEKARLKDFGEKGVFGGKRNRTGGKRWAKAAEVLAVVVVAFVLLMAGNLSPAAVHTNVTENSGKVPAKVKEVLTHLCESELDPAGEVVLAPDEVLEYARAYSAEIKLLYGRNMWQKELNAYTYDTYAPELEEVHKWLNPAVWEEGAFSDNLSAADALAVIRLYGGSILVLREEQFADAEVKAALAEGGCEEIARTEEYIILKLR